MVVKMGSDILNTGSIQFYPWKELQGLATLPHCFTFVEHLPQSENVAVDLYHETVGVLDEKSKVFQSSGFPAFG